MATKIIKAWIDGALQDIEVEDIISPAQPLSYEERIETLEDKHEAVISKGSMLVGDGTPELKEMTPSEVLEHINGASLQVLTTEEYNALGDDFNANVMYSLSDAEDEFVRIDEQTLTDEQKAQARANINANERTHWVEGRMVEILLECQLTYVEEDDIITVTENVPTLVVGETYTVNWNGTEYTCIGQDISAMMPGAVLLGDGSMAGVAGNGEPFALVAGEQDGIPMMSVIPKDDIEITLSIYHNAEIIHPIPGKFLPDGVPYVEGGMVEVLAETTLTEENVEEEMANIPPLGLVVGDTYTVKVNGVEYACVAGAYEDEGVPGISLIIPDLNMFIAELPPEMVEETGLNVAIEADANVAPLPITLFIYQNNETVHKLPGKLLPEGVPYSEGGGGKTDTLTFDGNIEGKTAIMIGDGMYFVNICDVYVDGSELIGGTATTVGLAEDFPNGTFELTEDMFQDATEMCGVPSYMVDELALVLSEDLTIDGITVPKGINVICAPGIGYISEVKAPSAIFIEKEIIHKLDNKYLDLEWLPIIKKTDTEILPETTSTEYSNNSTLKQSDLPGGMDIAVIFDGKRYECTVVGSGAAAYFGNLAIVNSENANTGEPFFCVSYNTNLAYGLNLLDENEHTIAIYKVNTEYNVIPEGFLGDTKNVTYTLSKSGNTITLTGSDGSTTSVTDSDTNTTYTLGSFGITATTEELNYVDGVTSPIQEQLDTKASVSDIPTSCPNPKSLIFTGASTASYDGSTEQTINVIGKQGTGTGAEMFNNSSEASGYASHAEGNGTTASGYASHAEGNGTTASGYASHAEGQSTIASGYYSHTEGIHTTASSYCQHVQGINNIEDAKREYLHIVGNGSTQDCSNAHTLDWDGNAWFAGDVYVGSTSGTHKDYGSKKLAIEHEHPYMGLNSVIAEIPKANFNNKRKWSCCAYGNDKFVAIDSDCGIIAYSEDGIIWTEIDTSIGLSVRDVAYGNNKFVACKYGSNIAIYSEDGINWTETTLPMTDSWTAIAYGNNKFVIVSGANSQIAIYSEDGINWTETTLPILRLYNLAFGDNKFVGFYDNNLGAYSEDGVSWTKITLPQDFDKTVYGNNKFVAIKKYPAAAAYSEDGINWIEITLPSTVSDLFSFDIVYGDNKFVIAYSTDRIAIYSEDGINWTETTLPVLRNHPINFVYGDNKFVGIPEYEDLTENSKLTFSKDGIVWKTEATYCMQNGIDVAEEIGDIIIDSKKLISSPTDATAGDLLMFDGTNWVKYSKADLIAEIIAALPSAEEASF